MNDENKKLLTEYLGECWHEMEPDLELNYGIYRCKKCLISSFAHKLYRRTFTTPADLHAIYSKMVEKGEWDAFDNWSWWYRKGAEPKVAHSVWLFCLNCPEQIPERMVMVAEWIERRKSNGNR